MYLTADIITCSTSFKKMVNLVTLISAKFLIFFLCSMKTYVVVLINCALLKCLAEALLMSTHNICYRGEIRKISIFFQMKKKLTLSGAMSSG